MDFKIEKLSDFIYDEKEFESLSNQIYYLTDHLSIDYPKHQQWFFSKHLPSVGKGNREVLFIRSFNNICGVSFLKKDDDERKICTFYIAEHGRNIGVGRALMEASFDYLETTKPMLTMSSEKVSYFIHFIYNYDWKITQIIENCYVKNVDEVVFNGFLNNENIK